MSVIDKEKFAKAPSQAELGYNAFLTKTALTVISGAITRISKQANVDISAEVDIINQVIGYLQDQFESLAVRKEE